MEAAVKDEVLTQVGSHLGEDIGVRGCWVVNSRFRFDYEMPGDTVIEKPGISRFDFRGSDFPFLHQRLHAFELEYTAGGSEWFNRAELGEVGSVNRDAVVAEMADFVEMGATTIWGMDEDYSPDPGNSFLCFHRDIDRYRSDLHLIESLEIMGTERRREYERALSLGSHHEVPSDYLPGFRSTDVVAAADQCPNVSVMPTNGGPVIYPDDFTGDRLYRFYDTLRVLIEARQ
jgi:hypothetical protein